jgi:hypothetical protein
MGWAGLGLGSICALQAMGLAVRGLGKSRAGHAIDRVDQGLWFVGYCLIRPWLGLAMGWDSNGLGWLWAGPDTSCAGHGMGWDVLDMGWTGHGLGFP